MSGTLHGPVKTPKGLRLVVEKRSGGHFVTFNKGTEVVDEAGPFDDHHDAVLAARRSAGPSDTVHPLPERKGSAGTHRSDGDSQSHRPMPAHSWHGEWNA